MSWKKALHRYIGLYNKLEIDQQCELVEEVVTDQHFLAKERQRAARIKEQHQDRGIKPIRNETRVRLSHMTRAGDAMETAFIMKRKMWYSYKEKVYVEERMEKQRTRWIQDGGVWRCGRVVEMSVDPNIELSEKLMHPSQGRDPAQTGQPYLNMHLLHGRPASFVYNRNRVKEYADLWWDHPNPEYTHFDVDCTNYVSQCLFAGGAPMNYTGKRDAGWWYRKDHPNDRWSFSWTVAHSLYWYFLQGKSGFHARQVESPDQLTIGDVIFYDFEGDGRIGHSTIVTAKDPQGMPLVNAHTVNSKHRYWDYRDSYAWTEQTRYYFFHMPDRV